MLYLTNCRLKTALSARVTYEIRHSQKNIHFYKYFCVKRGFYASPAARADDFTWTNFSPADWAPRLSPVRSPFESSEIPV